MFIILSLIILHCCFINASSVILDWETKNPAFDTSLYENVLDAVECERQLSYIQGDLNLRLQFLDAGLRIPKFITQGNILDMGNYYGCLGIQKALDDSTIHGKYCMISVPLNQDINFPEFLESPEFPEFLDGTFRNGTFQKELFRDMLMLDQLRMNEELMKKVNLFMETRAGLLTDDYSGTSTYDDSQINLSLAVCIPKSCTVREGLNGLLFNTTALGFQYQEQFCRLPNDKPWAPADYVAIVTFSLIGLLTLLSTIYDLRHRFLLRKDPKSVNQMYSSFSVYTNALRLTAFSKNPGALDCVDGIRALSMAWIILGHTFGTFPPTLNGLDSLDWLHSLRSIWITSGPLAVDTFFMMSGMLLVYSTAGKTTRSNLIKNLHLFYLNRILRMFPLFATVILVQASFLHWVSDGPQWQTVATNTESCRNYWWLSLLYVQNFFAPFCINHGWYLSIDMQLHILSPIVLYFVLSNSKRQAWVALMTTLLATLTASTIYVFMKEFQGSLFLHPVRGLPDRVDYMLNFYFFTLTRAPPFIVGMIFGYILHLCRAKPKIPTNIVILLWAVFITQAGLSLYSSEPTKDYDHDNQTVDNLVNAFSRTSWALAVASLIVVCVHGYGGPVNWLLSLHMWKMLSRISYSMYLFHYPIMFVITGTYVQPVYFTVIGAVYLFFSQFVISYVVGFATTLIIDSPFSTIIKQLLGGGLKKPPKESLPQVNNKTPQEDPKSQLKEGQAAENNSQNQ